jgi:hypothetical protein
MRKSAQEILAEYFPNIKTLDNETGEKIINAMEEYAQQFKEVGIIESILLRLERIEKEIRI